VSSPLPVYRDRPQWLPCPDVPGARDCIAIHDQEYFRLKADWRQRLAQAHPDAGGSPFQFRKLASQRERWEAAEQQWYSRRGLTLPTPPQPIKPAALTLPTLTKPPKTMQRVLSALADGAPRTAATLCAALGMTIKTLRVAVSRLRLRGYDIRCESKFHSGLTASTYRLVYVKDIPQ
jgi:biotin operon repressor